MKWEVTMFKIVLLRIAYVLSYFVLIFSGLIAVVFLAENSLHHSSSMLTAYFLAVMVVAVVIRLQSLLRRDSSLAEMHYHEKQIRQLARSICYRFIPNIQCCLPTYGGFILCLWMDVRNIRKADSNNSSLVTVRDDTYMSWIDFSHNGFQLSGTCYKVGNQMLILFDFFPIKRFSLKKVQNAFAALSLALYNRPWYYEDDSCIGLWEKGCFQDMF